MAIELTTSWQRISKQQNDFYYGGYYLVFTLRTHAYYERISNTVARIHYKLEITNDGATSWSGTNKTYYIHLNGQGPTDVQWADFIDAYGVYTIWEGSLDLSPNTEYSLHGKFNIPVGTSWDITDSVKTPAFSTAPTGLTITDIRPGIDSITATCNIDSWGNPDGSSSSYRELNVSSNGSDQTRRYQKVYGASKTGDITATNSSEVLGGMNITPNTSYYLWEYAHNGQVGVASSYTGYSTVTLAPQAINQSVSNITQSGMTINWTAPADGGRYDKKYYYSLDGTNWVECGTVQGGSQTSKNYAIHGLSPGKSYTIQFRVTTDAGTTSCNSFSASTKHSNIYCSVNNKTKEAKKIYCSVNGKTKLVKKVYASVGGVTKCIYSVQ